MSVFNAEVKKKIDGYLTRYETKRSSILPILHSIQDEYGWIKEEHIEALDKEFGLPKVQVKEVVTFYSMYRTSQPRKFQILFCDNIVCHMMGAKKVMHHIEEKVATLDKQLGADGPFSIKGVPCLGVCDGAPAMLVNKDRHLKVTMENVDAVLSKYAKLP